MTTQLQRLAPLDFNRKQPLNRTQHSNRTQNPLELLISRPRDTAWQSFIQTPCLFLARWLYEFASILHVPAKWIVDPLWVVCISDTHTSQPTVPDGDILIHAGDLTHSGTFDEIQAALSWLRGLPHPHKIAIGGNHDMLLDPARDDASGQAKSQREKLDWGDIVYLEDELYTVVCSNGRRVTIYGSPRTPKHGNWAFQYPRHENIWAERIPRGLDILVTHGPPRGHLDLLKYGCVHLLEELWQTRPRLHVFGHVHAGYGIEWLQFDGLQRAFERTVVDGGGVFNLFRVIHEFLRKMMNGLSQPKSQLVNAAAVGGLRDDERRLPFKVFI